MKILYEGIDITNSVDIKSAVISDVSGGKSDTLEIQFADVDGKWGKWKPEKGHTVELIDGGYSSGIMYVDILRSIPGVFVIGARSQPLNAKSNGYQAWENVRFKKVAADLAYQAGLEFEAYEIIDHLYTRIEKDNETPLECLNRLCIFESYALKIRDGKAVVYSEPVFEKKTPVKTFSRTDFIGGSEFEINASGLKAACIINYGDSSFRFDAAGATGGILKHEIKFYNIAEAERFSKGIIRQQNKFEKQGRIIIALSDAITAGNMVEINADSFMDGVYFIDECIRDLVNKKMKLSLRGILEGY